MRERKGYKNAEVYADQERLPAGGYILKVLNVKFEEGKTYKDNNGNQKKADDKIIVSFDITEGDYKDFYKKNYAAQTSEDKKWKGNYRIQVPEDDAPKDEEWKMRRFKTIMVAFEESNPGFHWDWDEQKLKGKLIGALFNNKEYDFNGRHGFFTNCHSLVTVEKIRSGNFTIPDDTLLKNSNKTPAPQEDTGFMNIPTGLDSEEFPWN